MKFTELLTYSVSGTNTEFSIEKENHVIHIINSVSIANDKSKTLYRFDVQKGTVTTFDILKPITHMDNDKFQKAFFGEWYRREFERVERVASAIKDINIVTDKEDAKDAMSPDEIEICIEKYNLISKRVAFVRDAIENHVIASGDTVACIVSACRNESVFPNTKSALDAMTANAKNGMDTKKLKDDLLKSVNAFVRLFWRECDRDGIMPYSCNVNNTMLRDVASVANGKHIVKNGLSSRLYGTAKSVACECVLTILETLQERKEKESKSDSESKSKSDSESKSK